MASDETTGTLISISELSRRLSVSRGVGRKLVDEYPEYVVNIPGCRPKVRSTLIDLVMNIDQQPSQPEEAVH